MAIRDERTSTTELLRDSRYHRAALAADPNTKDFVGPVKKVEQALRARRDAAEERADVRAEKLAILLRTDYELDERLRHVELEVLAGVKKDRGDSRYRSTFPQGLGALVALRGEDEAIAVKLVVKGLQAHFSDLAKRHAKELEALAAATAEAEKGWRHAGAEAAEAGTAEVIARSELVRQLQKNEGALLATFPGERRRVRSFFRPTRRGGSIADEATSSGDSPAQDE